MSENQYRKNTFHALVGYVLLFLSMPATSHQETFLKNIQQRIYYTIYMAIVVFLFFIHKLRSTSVFFISVKMTKRNRTNAGLKETEIMFCVGHIENKLTSKWVMFYRYRSILLH